MKLLKRFVHLPSGSIYNICVLESECMKNQAFALLHRKYIEESKTPWEFPKDNPSNIRIEKRTVDGKTGVPTLVDDFEHTAFTLGVVSSSGKVVGTGRMLLRDKMLDGRLEIERYNSLPPKIRTTLEEKRCRVELNRVAIADCLNGYGSAFLMYVSILSEVSSLNFAEPIMWTQPFSLYCKYKKGIPGGYAIVAATNTVLDLGSFKYAEEDPEPVMVCNLPKYLLIAFCILRSLKSGTILVPSFRLEIHKGNLSYLHDTH